MTSRDEILDILRKAYQIEVDGYTFYSMTAEKSDKPAVQELFDKLARDEVEHQAYLKAVVKRYDADGTAAFRMQRRAPELRAFSEQVFTDRFRSQAQGASFEVGVLSVGMTLESNAIDHFSRAAAAASEQEVRGFYQFLTEWERQHLAALQNLYNAVREDFWREAAFAPF